ncbi:MAG TPA: hypothetical protein VK787_10375 [Puia sp.]|jgi:hypothetical protein|nr:hypothetical protein [Puia sp.]
MQLTQKDLRAIELVKKYNRHDLVESLADYHLLVDTLLYLHEAIAEERVQINYWQKDSETLFYKFAFHGLTLHQIFNGLKLSSVYYKVEMDNKSSIDISSARAILRAQFEAFLMYHHIYVNPVDDDLKELRHNAWIYSSLLQRQKFPSKTEFGKQQKAKDKIKLNKMKETISKLKSFQNLSARQQQSLLDTGSGKLFSHWATILKETGFSENTPFYTIYTLLSAYSHSEGLSIIQLSYQPDSHKNVINQVSLDLYQAKLLICLMINSIMKLHGVVKKKHATLPDQLKYDIEIYSMMAMRDKT